MKLYRAMCKEEWEKSTPFSWKTRFKWFGTKTFVLNRVRDGKFNNSSFVNSRYDILVEYEFDDNNMKHFVNCGKDEYMLDRRKAPLINVMSMKVVHV